MTQRESVQDASPVSPGRAQGPAGGPSPAPCVYPCVTHACLSVSLFFSLSHKYIPIHAFLRNDMGFFVFFLALDFLSEDLLSNPTLWWLCRVTLDETVYLPGPLIPHSPVTDILSTCEII